jgi:hypothetical protein
MLTPRVGVIPLRPVFGEFYRLRSVLFVFMLDVLNCLLLPI